jgi:hypothetical protein
VQNEKTACHDANDSYRIGSSDEFNVPDTYLQEAAEKRFRQTRWAVEVLASSLKEIEVRRTALQIRRDSEHS